MKTIAIIALMSLAFVPAYAGLAGAAKSAVKVTKPSATVDENGVKVTKPAVNVTKPTLPEVKKPEIKKPEVNVTKPAATLDENGLKVTKPGIKLK